VQTANCSLPWLGHESSGAQASGIRLTACRKVVCLFDRRHMPIEGPLGPASMHTLLASDGNIMSLFPNTPFTARPSTTLEHDYNARLLQSRRRRGSPGALCTPSRPRMSGAACISPARHAEVAAWRAMVDRTRTRAISSVVLLLLLYMYTRTLPYRSSSAPVPVFNNSWPSRAETDGAGEALP